MTYNEKVLIEQIHLLRDFVSHYTSYRFLIKRFDTELIKQDIKEFWLYTINAHYFQAINLWCMIFGTNKNETHWRKLGLKEDFQPFLLDELNMNQTLYKSYWDTILEWRNKYSAHRDPGYLNTVPDLKIARGVVLTYEKWIEKNVDLIIPFSLKLYEEDFEEKLKENFDKMINLSI